MSEFESIHSVVGECRLKRTARKTLAISVLPDGTVELVSPRGSSLETIQAKVAKRATWIRAQRFAFSEMNNNRVPLRYVSGATHRYLGRQYRLKVQIGSSPGVILKGGYFVVTTSSRSEAEVKTLLDAWYRNRAESHLERRLSKWSGWCLTHKLPTPKLRLHYMAKRWGSAQPNGVIRINPDLIRMPSICIDYVISHEICHLRYPSHDRKFYRQLSELMPNWQTLKGRLESASL